MTYNIKYYYQGSTEQGPQIDEEQMKKILGYVGSGKAEGAKLLAGGNRWGLSDHNSVTFPPADKYPPEYMIKQKSQIRKFISIASDNRFSELGRHNIKIVL